MFAEKLDEHEGRVASESQRSTHVVYLESLRICMFSCRMMAGTGLEDDQVSSHADEKMRLWERGVVDHHIDDKSACHPRDKNLENQRLEKLPRRKELCSQLQRMQIAHTLSCMRAGCTA